MKMDHTGMVGTNIIGNYIITGTKERPLGLALMVQDIQITNLMSLHQFGLSASKFIGSQVLDRKSWMGIRQPKTFLATLFKIYFVCKMTSTRMTSQA